MTVTTPALYQPAIPPAVRTFVYVLGLVVGFLSILAIGLVAIFWPDVATQATAAAGVTGTAVGFLASALGVVYRPTAGASLEQVADAQAADNDRDLFPYTDGDDAA